MGRASWDARVKMNPDALTDILFWDSSLRKLNEQGVDICRVDHDFVSDFDIFCDASDVGFGGYLSTQCSVVICVDVSEMSGNWTSDEKLESSTWRKLECARRVLCTYESKFSLDNKSVSINSDNKNVLHILKVGSKKSILQNIAVDIHNICSAKTTLDSKWLLRADNQYADKLSRNTDNDDWGIHGELFNYFNGTWGPYSIDRFATHYNTQCTRFNSKHWCPGSEGIDAFSQNWGNDTNWLVPPPALVPMVLQKVQHDKAACTLVIPEWKSAPFWPLIYTSKGVNLRRNVEAALVESGVSENCNLYNLARKMTTFLVDSRSENTCKKYYSSFNRWKKFAIENSLNELPTEPVHKALYITKLIDEQCSPSVVNSAVYSIKWAHDLNGSNDPTENSFVKYLLESDKRRNSRPVNKKDPVNNDMLIDLCSMYTDSSDLLIVRDLTMILLSYSGFLRFDEISKLGAKMLKLFISHSKTDQYRQGNEIFISKGITIACPINMYLRYLFLAGLDAQSEQFIFKPIFRSKGVPKLIYKIKPISYTAAKENIVKRLKLVAPSLNLGLHSLRSGGATAAAKSNVNERCIKRHGRWKTDFVKDGYIEDTLEKRISVSQKLGL
ncbi:Hypothetical predicted protein [Mytilus galloprovincialis]|nr:Hypothetical predicted protein [Mytilus galloprovincialis]